VHETRVRLGTNRPSVPLAVARQNTLELNSLNRVPEISGGVVPRCELSFCVRCVQKIGENIRVGGREAPPSEESLAIRPTQYGAAVSRPSTNGWGWRFGCAVCALMDEGPVSCWDT